MTDEAYRGKGYSRTIMERVLKDCDRSFEGVYLFAEDHMSGFYEKFGFMRKSEYQCRKKVNITNPAAIEKISMESKEEQARMVDIIRKREQYGDHIMVNNPGLFMFYLAGPFSDNVYYVPSSEAYVVANVVEDTLTLYAIFADDRISLGDIISSFGNRIKRVIMAFSPENNTGFDQKMIESEDSVMLVRGSVFESAVSERFMFPEISHA